MIKHVVFFKLKECNEKNKEEVNQKLLSLIGEVKEIVSLEVGLNFSDEARAYDLSLIVELKSREDLLSYAKNSYHQEVISFIKTKVIDTKVVDYEN